MRYLGKNVEEPLYLRPSEHIWIRLYNLSSDHFSDHLKDHFWDRLCLHFLDRLGGRLWVRLWDRLWRKSDEILG